MLFDIFLSVTREQSIILIFLLGYIFADKKIFVQALGLLLFTMVYNHFLKDIFQVPLPAPLQGYALPSGHMHSAAAFLGYLAWQLRSNRALMVTIFAVLLAVGLSLVAKGYHYPLDIFAALGFAGVSIAVSVALCRLAVVAERIWLYPLLLLIAALLIHRLGIAAGPHQGHLYLAEGGLAGVSLACFFLAQRGYDLQAKGEKVGRRELVTLAVALLGLAAIFFLGSLVPMEKLQMKTFVLYALVGSWMVVLPALLAAKEKPALYVYFDVNKTIIMSDRGSNKNETDVINGILAEHVEALHHDWGQTGVRESYYDYLTRLGKSLYPHDYHERKDYRNELVHRFVAFLEDKYPELAERAKEYTDALHLKLAARQHGNLVQAFSRFVAAFQASKRGYPADLKIVFRTFGQDLNEIESAVVGMNSEGKTPFERGEFTAQGTFVFQGKVYPRAHFGAALRQNSKAFFVGIADSYSYWRGSHFAAQAGKPLPVFQGRSFTPLFDDNIKGEGESLAKRDIIHPYWEHDKKGILPRELLGSWLIRVNPFEVLQNENYFIEEYNKACVRAGFPEYQLEQGS